jgi:2-polyprenyl-3-methyl-5-hydroxy-6-metoxy-1,4-benzoquinol methylase
MRRLAGMKNKLSGELWRIGYFLRTGYYSRGERVIPDFPDENFQNHFKVYKFVRSFAAGRDVLDVGCGTGYGTAHLAEVARSVVGIDISRQAIRWARKHYLNVDFREMDAQNITLPDRSLDLIVSTENLEHLPDQRAHCKELARLLRPDGLCFVASPNPEMFVGQRNPYHTKENSYGELMALFSGLFKDVKILDNMNEPSTEAGQAMKRERLARGETLAKIEGLDETWLHNTHSFFCFLRQPVGD